MLALDDNECVNLICYMYVMILWLAPMDGWTDCAMRIVTKEVFDKYNKNPENKLFLWTEFMHAHWYLINPANLSRHIFKTDFDSPLILQIFGWEWEFLEKAVLDLDKKYWNLFYWIEINMGCPANKVVNSGWGSGMLKDKDKSLKILKNIRKNYKWHLSIKTRTWLDDVDKDRQKKFLLEAGEVCDMISVHWRTFKAGYAGESDWEFIYGLKDTFLKLWLWCKVIWNWWIKTFSDIEERKGNLDWIMVGQWAMWNPWIFVDYEPSIQDKFNMIINHLDIFVKTEIEYFNQKQAYEQVWENGEFLLKMLNFCDLKAITENDILEHEKENKLYSIIEFRKHLFNYVKGIEWSKEFKVQCSACNTYLELKNFIIRFFG